MHFWLPLFLVFAPAPGAEAPVHKIDVRIAGPLAMVEVWRTVEANVRTLAERQIGTFLDLDLPEGAVLLNWDVRDGRARTRLAPQSVVEASAGLAAALRLRRLTLPPPPAEDFTGFRVHVTPIADGERAVLHYRYSALARCKGGRLVLRVPESQEENPVPADVVVTIERLPDATALAVASLAGKPAEMRPGANRLVMRAVAPARTAWDIGWSYVHTPGSPLGTALVAAAQVMGVGTANGRARTVPQYAMAGLLCRPDTVAKSEIPARVMLLVDRSRSVGQGGLSAERALARSLVEALPPSVQFNAVLFGLEAVPLFALPRIPTREALDAFTGAADPNRLENGTDVAAALARARALQGDGDGAAQSWIVLITDGALPVSQTFERMQTALGGTGERVPRVLVLLVRQLGDDPVPASSVTEYARFARAFGGLVRVLPPGSPGELARGILADMARGGDLLDVQMEGAKMADAVPPGQAASLAFTSGARLPREKRVRMSAHGMAGPLQVETLPALVNREWIEPLLASPRSGSSAWSGATSGMALAILPAALSPVKKPGDGVVRGHMDSTVLRNALALAFTPRARACYVSRRVAKAGDANLRGRLKLELTIERGELNDAAVRQSTLANPDIENCVRRAAWAVEYPRPEHRDAPTTANLNLVFQPRTQRETVPDAMPADREIELILGPLTFTADFTDLLEDKPTSK